jgi:hypothetical protein
MLKVTILKREIEMKKLKGLKIRKVWAIKPVSRIKADSKRIKLIKLRINEMREQLENRVRKNLL